jgi:capsular exopolysaccharide synthesis family protein
MRSLREQGYGDGHLEYRSAQSQLNGTLQSYDSEREKMTRRIFDGQIETLRRFIASTRASEDELLRKLEEEQKRGTELSKIRAKIEDIKDEIDHLQEAKTKMADDLNNLRAMAGLDTAYRILKLQSAQRPREVTFPKIILMIPAGILVVSGLVLGVVLLIEVVDQRVKGPSDVQMISRTRVLGLVPHAAEAPDSPAKVETVYRDQPGGVLAESYRQLCGTVLKQMAQGGHKSLLVLSAMPGAGTTTTVCNLAYVMAAAEHKVLIVDANLRRPMVGKTLGLQDAPGLSDVLSGAQMLASAVQGTDNPMVSVLTAGAAATRKIERLATPAMTELLREAAKTYDVILVDVAPAVVAGDAMALANRCDASLLVVRAMREKRGMIARLRNELAETRADFLGVIVNAARSAAGGYLRGNIRATHEYQSEQV